MRALKFGYPEFQFPSEDHLHLFSSVQLVCSACKKTNWSTLTSSVKNFIYVYVCVVCSIGPEMPQ